MNILLIQKAGTDLHHTLFSSETSRLVLRFYHPKKKSCGVYISCSTLSSALSLVAELRWYIRRYVREPLFEWERGIFFTHELAQDVYYERTAVLSPGWKYRKLYGFKDGKLVSTVPMSPGSTLDDYHQEYAGVTHAIEIWCNEDEVEEGELIGEAESPGNPDHED
ncbi:DUF5804 family protein [uncultured Methanoregula sp.]|uniref:DUF5804 family protein n=1 Tax=uncultured Methanoregula sp. TaxID=1005933 RepID=UPI002AAA7DD6|nr:DUF5804 family protein [uncultured Methanoregula sp.]